MIRLFTSAYPEQESERADELWQCLQRNLANPAFTGVQVLVESMLKPQCDLPGLAWRHSAGRPLYADFLSWAKEVAPTASDVTVIANCDIYFDPTIATLGAALGPGQCAVLSRWNIQPDGSAKLFDRNDSQDAWVFKGLPREVKADFPVGVPRCDNRFLYELQRAGYEVINPAFAIRIYHLHSGQRTEYQGENLEHFVDPPYAYLWPHNLWSLPRTLWHNLKNPSAQIGWRLDRRRMAGSLPVRAAKKLIVQAKSQVRQSIE